MTNTLHLRLLQKSSVENKLNLARTPPPINGTPGIRYLLDEQPVVSFCSNDYLGLLTEKPDLQTSDNPPSGSAGSRLICGNHKLIRETEDAFAEHLGFEDALLFPSGYQAALAVIPTLIDSNDNLYSDRLNHASLIDAMRLAKTPVQILDHLHCPPLPSSPTSSLSWWITESVFSMDGDRSSFEKLTDFNRGGGYTIVDEAHSIGLFSDGRGLYQKMPENPTVLLCPLGKAFASSGAIVATTSLIGSWLRGHARPYIFSTGPSPAFAQHLHSMLKIVAGPVGQKRRKNLWSNVEMFSKLLGQPCASPIFPIVVGSNDLALRLSSLLLQHGWHVQAIRPPTVPPQSSRLRITITAAHTPSEIQSFASILLQLLSSLQISPSIRTRPPTNVSEPA